MSAITPNFAGEMQLAGWSESHTGGCKVTFWLQGPDELAAFRALTVRKGNTAGHRFMAALVEIGDDELPVQPGPVIKESLTTEKPKGGALAKLAGMWCQDPEFQNWVQRQTCTDDRADESGPNEAKLFVLETCGIDSRAELDNDDCAARLFHLWIRGPFSKWLFSRGVLA